MASMSPGDALGVSVLDAAKLVALALERTTSKVGRPRNRIRMSYRTFRRLTGRRIGGASFVKGFTTELMNLGWLMVRMPSAYGFVRAASLAKWPLTKSDVIAEELKLIEEGSRMEVLEYARQELDGSGDVAHLIRQPQGASTGRRKKERVAR
ncbi:hypothetical protein [Arvimicrobium flavum]|uniref:hypothetical protein n=1 Tax=Arvimicrobium flavum TaxID=3393320 RepID=UPI00237B0E0F|nr:hypothetical protein [Mesorhizobium shangrilense]